MLVEVTVIDSGAALPRVLDQIVWALRFKLKYGKLEAFDIATAVSEICQNTFDHNEGTCGFLAMQGYGKGRGRFLEIGVSDNGAGLRTTLLRNLKNSGLASDLDSIRAAIRLGTSEHDDPTRGTGLHHLMEIAYRHGGMVQIWSGRAKARFRMDRKTGWGFHVPHVAGVHLALVLSAKSRKAG
jgi:anti-sigma regulatory factor (Ser/Thr protein kinase)